MIWYAMMFNKDRDSDFEHERNMTEYLASFINSEAVRQTRDARETQKIMPDQDFEQLLREQFGRDLNPDVLAHATRAEAEDAAANRDTRGNSIRKRRQRPVATEVKKKGAISIADIKKYTGLELDDIKFIPKK